MMEANDMLLWTMLRDHIRVLPEIKSDPQIEQFHLTAVEPDAAQQGGRGDELELGLAVFGTAILLNHSLLTSGSSISLL
jgi:hypothetical protein